MSCGIIQSTIAISGDCTNSSLGSVFIEFTGSTAPPYTVSEATTSGLFPTSAATLDYFVDNLPPGNYTITVEDFCIPPTIDYINIVISSGTCVSIETSGTTCGLDNGILNITFTPFYGLGTVYLYDINDNYIGSATTTTQTLTYPQALSAGTYYVIGDDGGGCTGRSESCIIYSSTPIDYGFYVVDNNSCNGLVNNGKIYVTGITGNPPFTYLWSNGETTSSITGLTNGFYSVTVTDNNGCSLIKTTEVKLVPSVEVVSMIPTQPTCFSNDGEVTVNVLGGTAPYFYSGSNGSTVVTFSQSYTFTGLSAGAFSVFVNDSGLCNDTASTLLLTPNTFTIASITTTNSNCSNNDGAINVILNGGSPSGNFQYTLIDSSGNTVANFTTLTTASFTGLYSDVYTLEITNGSGCVFTTTITVTNTDLFTISATTTDTTCGQNNGSVTIFATTGGTAPYSYQITGYSQQSTPTFTGIPPGNYVATVIDNNGCTQTIGFTIQPSTSVYFDLYVIPTTNGNDGEIQTLITSGEPPFTYNWSPNVTGQTGSTITGLTTGIYTLTVTDNNGCTFTKTAKVLGTEIVSATQNYTVCFSNFQNTGVIGKRGMLQMLNEGYYDLTNDDTNCVLNSAIFTAKVSVDGVETEQTFYTGTTLTDYPTDNNWVTTIQNLLLGYEGISDVVFNLTANTITIINNCDETTKNCKSTTYNLLTDAKVVINLTINYNISCVSCGTTPTTTTTTTCVFNEWEIQLGGPCTFDLLDCDGNTYDTVTFLSGGTYTICSPNYQQNGICSVGTITNLGPCTP